MGNLYLASKTGMKTFQYVVGSTTVVEHSAVLGRCYVLLPSVVESIRYKFSKVTAVG